MQTPILLKVLICMYVWSESCFNKRTPTPYTTTPARNFFSIDSGYARQTSLDIGSVQGDVQALLTGLVVRFGIVTEEEGEHVVEKTGEEACASTAS